MAFPAAAALVVFVGVIAAVIFLILKPKHLRVHFFGRTWAMSISYCWMPLLGAVVLLLCQSLDMHAVGQGVKGDEHIQPYGILILFMALAYISASLDCTGLFAYIALRITQASGGRGHLLFFFMYGMSAAMTALTSNDVSIMTLTPIIIYFSRATKCDPMPFLVAEFVAANIWSMLLFVGNPTNIIVAQAYKLSFIGYSKWMALPTIVAGLVSVLLLYLNVRHRLPVQLNLPDIYPETMLTDKVGAWFGGANMALCLLLLALAPTLAWDMWLTTLVCALVHAAYNVIAMVSLDPVTRQWVGLTTLLGRKMEPMNERKHSTCSYTPQTLDEQEADAILTQECGPSADYRFTKPQGTPKPWFLAFLHSTLASTLQAKPHVTGPLRRKSHSGIGGTTHGGGFAPPSPVSHASRLMSLVSSRGSGGSLMHVASKGLTAPSLSRASIDQLGMPGAGVLDGDGLHGLLQASRTASLSRSRSWGHGLSTTVAASEEVGDRVTDSGMGVMSGSQGMLVVTGPMPGSVMPTSPFGRAMMASDAGVDVQDESTDGRMSAPQSLGALCDVFVSNKQFQSPTRMPFEPSTSHGAAPATGGVSLPLMPLDLGMLPSAQASTKQQQQVGMVQETASSLPTTPRAIPGRHQSFICQGSLLGRDLRRAGSDRIRPNGKAGVAGSCMGRDSSGALDSPQESGSQFTGASGPSTLLLATASTLEDVRLAWRREQQQHHHQPHPAAIRGRTGGAGHTPSSANNSHHSSSAHGLKSRLTHVDTVDSLIGQDGSQREGASGKTAVSQSRLAAGVRDGKVGTGGGQDHERNSSGHGNGKVDSGASTHQNGWVQKALVELAWRPPVGAFEGVERTSEGGNGHGIVAGASTPNPSPSKPHRTLWGRPGTRPAGPQTDGTDTERMRLLSSMARRSSGSGVPVNDSQRRIEQEDSYMEEGRVTPSGEGKGGLEKRWKGEGLEGDEGEEEDVEMLEPPTRSFLRILTSLPWEVVPFVLGMFIIVEGLKVQGWVEQLSKVLGTASGLGKTGGTLFLMGSFSVALANVINNQPMTILLTQVCLQPIFLSSASPTGDETDAVALSTQRTALFALVVGSNVGALFSLIGALAGIMWSNIMKGMNITITYMEFVRIMLPIGVTSMLSTLLVLWAEFGVN